MTDVERRLRELGERTAERVTYGGVPSAGIVRRVRMRRGAALVATGTAAVLLATVVYPRVADTVRDGGESPIRLAAVAEATEQAGSARMEMEMHMEFSTRDTTMRMTGAVDFERRLSELRMEQAGVDGTEVMELLTVGDSVFQRVVEEGEEPSKWYEMELPGSAGAGALGATDPSDFLSYLRSVAQDVTDLGTAVVDGVEVRHYRAELEMPTMAEAMPQGIDADLEPMEVWVDSLGRLRRMTFGVTTDGPTAGFDGSMQMTMRLWDFGIPVDVVAPSPDEITDEPPEWAGPSVDGDDSGEPFDAEFITGPDGWEGPYVLVTEAAGGMSFLCVNQLPGRWREVAIVQESSGRSVVTLAPETLQRGGGSGTSRTCGKAPISHEDADALKGDPEDFVVRIERASGDVTVELEEIGSFAE